MFSATTLPRHVRQAESKSAREICTLLSRTELTARHFAVAFSMLHCVCMCINVRSRLLNSRQALWAAFLDTGTVGGLECR